MNDQDSSELWKRLGPLFFRKPAPPTPFETEAFVARVMGRVEERRAAGSPLNIWLRWLLPAAGLAALLLVAVPSSDASIDLGPDLDSAALILTEEP